MKKILSQFAIILCMFVLTQSCKKNNITKTIDVAIKSNEDYLYDLGGFGDEEGASISRQATHDQLSLLTRDSNFVSIIYKYKPALNYIGTDEVELKSERGSDGGSRNDNIIITTIKFTISN